ncbi:MAG: response regulator [Candidatus Rokubacteria bacterium]|nr:response regulator [Candidatus Rokubacteria bacterium]
MKIAAPGSAVDARAAQEPTAEARPWPYVLVFVLGLALVSGFMWFHIANERRVAREHWKARMSTIADDRARLVSGWIKARRADAEVLSGLPAVRALLTAPGGSVDGIGVALDRVTRAYGYSVAALLDPRGRVVARSGGSSDLGPGSAAVAAAVAGSGAFRVELSVDGSGRKHLDFGFPVPADPTAKPVADRAPPMLGMVLLRMSPETSLFPLLTEESVRTRTGELLLFRVDGREPGYLSPFRHSAGGWGAVGRSREALTVKAGDAARGLDTFDELIDYRSAPVFAATRWLPDASWGLVHKIDTDEALADFHQSGRLTGLAAGFLLVALGASLISLWRQRQRALLLSEQMKQERAIFTLKSYAEKIVASVPSGLLVLSGDLRILSANRSFLDAFYLRPDEVLGRRLVEVVQADGLVARILETLQTGVAQQDVFFDLQLTFRRESRPARITMTGIRIAEDEEARLLLIVQDLSEEERLQAARLTSEQRFQDLVQGLDAIVWEANAATFRFTFVSERAKALLGYPTEHWLREPDFWSARIHPEDRERVLAVSRQALAAGTDHEVEYRAVAADGRSVWVRDIVHVAPDNQGQPRQLRGLTVDLTERKQAEEALRQSEDQLRQAQKMEAVGQLAGGVAHDFNNLLMVIQGDSDLILRRLPEGHTLRRNAEGIREAAQQAASLTRQLLAFSRKQVLAPRVVDLNGIVGGMHPMLQRLLGETIHLVTVPKPDLGSVKADPGQIEQVIMNLAVNARDAMPDGGRLTIETGTLELDEVTARQHGEAAPGRYALLAVTDTGSGMDAATRARIFEPFFTTKESGKGTGLGLSTVYGIVKQSGGHIWVYSEPGRGTTFKICLPVVPEELDSQAGQGVELPAETTARGAETVLLVEDAARVREVVREILEMSGYVVLEAKLGAEAVQISQRHPGRIHLLVTDVVMPQMSGRELAQHLTISRPDMRVLFISGYTDDAIVRHGVLESGVAFLSKPFTPDALTAKVREVLDAPRSGGDAPKPSGPRAPRPVAPRVPSLPAGAAVSRGSRN